MKVYIGRAGSSHQLPHVSRYSEGSSLGATPRHYFLLQLLFFGLLRQCLENSLTLISMTAACRCTRLLLSPCSEKRIGKWTHYPIQIQTYYLVYLDTEKLNLQRTMSILTYVCRSLRFSFAQHYSLAVWVFFIFQSFWLLHWLPAFFFD